MTALLQISAHVRRRPVDPFSELRKAKRDQLLSELKAAKVRAFNRALEQMQAEICYELYRDLFPEGQW